MFLQYKEVPLLSFFVRAVRDARHDPFFPAPWYIAPLWVLWHWRWLRGVYAEEEQLGPDCYPTPRERRH